MSINYQFYCATKMSHAHSACVAQFWPAAAICGAALGVRAGVASFPGRFRKWPGNEATLGAANGL